MDFHKIIYGGAYYRCRTYDTALRCFKYADYIPFNAFDNQSLPPDFWSVFEFLKTDGMCRFEEFGIRITERGRAKILGGGYTRTLLFDRLSKLSVVMAVAGGTFSALVYLFGMLFPKP